MPDVTLYQDDVEQLRGVCLILRNKLYNKGKQQVLNHDEYSLIQSCERLKDLLLLRLVQNLHPKRE